MLKRAAVRRQYSIGRAPAEKLAQFAQAGAFERAVETKRNPALAASSPIAI
jgi:hypothetical protein